MGPGTLLVLRHTTALIMELELNLVLMKGAGIIEGKGEIPTPYSTWELSFKRIKNASNAHPYFQKFCYLPTSIKTERNVHLTN